MSTKTAVEQRCCKCDEPTGKCGDDSYYVNFIGPLCEKCFDEMTFKMNTKTAVELSIGDGLTKVHFLEYRIEILQNTAVELGQKLAAANATLKEIAEWLVLAMTMVLCLMD